MDTSAEYIKMCEVAMPLLGKPEMDPQQVFLGDPNSPVEGVRQHKGVLLLKLGGCDDRDAAGGLRGMLVQVPLEDAVPLEEGEYYHFQLMGLRVETEDGQWLGQLVEVLSTGANDVYIVRGPHGELLLPAVDDVVLELDLASKRMVVRLMRGMLAGDET